MREYILLAISMALLHCVAHADIVSYKIGEFSLSVDRERLLLTASYGSDDRVLWRTLGSSRPFLQTGKAVVPRPPILDGNFQMEETVAIRTARQTVDTISYNASSEVLTIGGVVDFRPEDWLGDAVQYSLAFSVSPVSTKQLRFTIDTSLPAVDESLSTRLFLRYRSEQGETFHGFGESFTNFDMSGRRIPVLVSEQGVGRGEQPITAINNKKAEGIGGHWYTTYCPKPLYLTNFNRSLLFENSEVTYFDLTTPLQVEVELWGSRLVGNILYGQSMKQLVSEITLYTGRMRAPPAWSQKGAIVGLEGGTESVSAIVDTLRAGGVPLAGVWLQDWVGMRHDWDGDRLIWNWEVNYDWYPGWQDMVRKWSEDGTRVLTYVNPFFSDPSNYTDQNRHNFYQEGIEKGYFVKRANGSAYNMFSLSIEFCMVDLTNPEAVLWMKSIIKEYSMQEAGSSGWMADFGEYLPFDAVLFSGESAASYHNRYPEDWAKLTHEVLAENNREDDILYFMRSAWLQSPKYNSIFWEGDQLVSWDANDGLKNVVLGALSGGISGHAITHSDIGGYTVVTDCLQSCVYLRSEELLNRWTELSAFGAGLFRTHVGSSRSTSNFNVYDSPESIAHFAEFANIYSTLKPYRDTLIAEAVTLGLPIIRPLAMNYAYDPNAWVVEEAYLFGDDFLVAPCMDEGATTTKVYLPALSGVWVHLWDGSETDASSEGKGLWLEVSSPIGFPPVFYQASSKWGRDLRAFVLTKGYTDGFPGSLVL